MGKNIPIVPSITKKVPRPIHSRLTRPLELLSASSHLSLEYPCPFSFISTLLFHFLQLMLNSRSPVYRLLRASAIISPLKKTGPSLNACQSGFGGLDAKSLLPLPISISGLRLLENNIRMTFTPVRRDQAAQGLLSLFAWQICD